MNECVRVQYETFPDLKRSRTFDSFMESCVCSTSELWSCRLITNADFFFSHTFSLRSIGFFAQCNLSNNIIMPIENRLKTSNYHIDPVERFVIIFKVSMSKISEY